MTIIQAVILGFIQGLASMLPVSGSGHTVLAASLMGVNANVSLKFLAVMHIGTLLAVIITSRTELRKLVSAAWGMLVDLVHNARIFLRHLRAPEAGEYRPVIATGYRKFVVLLLVSMGPALVTALLIQPFAEEASYNVLMAAVGFFATALILIVSSFSDVVRKKPASTTYRNALLIGALTGLSGFPGVSRMGMAVAGGSYAGLSRKYMIEYALMLSIPSILGGLILEGGSGAASLASSVGIVPCIFAVLASGISGYLAIGFVRKHLSANLNKGFATYLVIAGIFSIVTYFR